MEVYILLPLSRLPFEFMEKVNFVNEIGRDNFFDTKSEAIKVLYERLDKSKCEKCQALVFNECH
jgi:SulP family sulfate permease